jgi:hypothetical protein
MIPGVALDVEQQIIVRERLRLLAIGYYIKGAMGAALVSIFLLHFFMLIGLSVMPQTAGNAPVKPVTTAQAPSVLPSPSSRPVNQPPPVMMLRIFAAAIGVIILLGWTFGALTIYAGRCVQKRTHRVFIFIIAGLNCVLIPWGTLLGIATFIVIQSPAGQEAFRNPPDGMPPPAV